MTGGIETAAVPAGAGSRETLGAKLARRGAAFAAAASMAMTCPYVFFAGGASNPFSVSVNTSGMEQTFKDPNAIMGMVVGLAIWVCRMVGVGMLIWGIYGYVTARKDGEAEAMNGALGKLISGAVLLGMQGILKAFNIVA